MLFIEKYIPQLSAMYSEPHRDYHSLTHIHGLYRIILSGSWQGLLQKKSDATSGNTQAISRKLSFIAWFHDCYYDPYLGSPKNEQVSADIFQAMVLPDATYSGASSFMDSVYEGIMLTSRHLSQLEVGCHDFEHLLFMDLDMLGFAYKDEFLRNNVSVRNEYYKTSDVEYLTNRLKFLKALLAKDRIYYLLSDELEASARVNISESIETDSRMLDILAR